MIEGLPKKRNPKEPVLAKDWNMLIDAIIARTPQRCDGMDLYRDRRGFFYRAKNGPVIGGKPVPLTIILSKPRYLPAPEEPPPQSAKRVFIEWGTLNDRLATNWDEHWDIADTTYFFAKATLRATDTLKVVSWEVVTGSESDSHVTSDWPVGGERPTEAVCLLGVVHFEEGEFRSISNSGGGSLSLTEHIQSILSGSGAGEVQLGRQLIFSRLGY